MYCPKGFIDLDPKDGFCYRLDTSVSVKNNGAELHCSSQHGAKLTTITSKAIKDAHVRELARSKLEKVYLKLTLERGYLRSGLKAFS